MATSPPVAAGIASPLSPSGVASPPASAAPFDLSRLKGSYPDLSAYRSACLHLAKAAERAERYDDAARFVREIMKCTAQDGSEMTEEEKQVSEPYGLHKTRRDGGRAHANNPPAGLGPRFPIGSREAAQRLARPAMGNGGNRQETSAVP